MQVREEDDVLAFLRGQGLNPNALSRQLLEAHVRKLRWQATAERFRARPRDLGDVVAEVRRARDQR